MEHDPQRQPDPSRLLGALELTRPLVGFYDAPDPAPFTPLVEPVRGAARGACVFDFFRRWEGGETLHLTRDNYGCGGAGRALCEAATRSRDDFIDFLWREEGLRASRELMAAWVDHSPVYVMRHDHILIGPLRPEQFRHLRTVTFWVNPDQLSILQQGAYHGHAWGEPPAVIVPFGSGCMELVVTFDDLTRPQAAIGATDIAMRDQLPRDLLAFTVTVPMFERLCALDDDSFLHKGFLRDLRAARGSIA
jgi:hypothetical protein